MDAQPKTCGGFGCFKGVLQIPFFLLMRFHNRGNSRKIEVYKAVTISPKRRPGALLWGPRAHWGCAVVLDC